MYLPEDVKMIILKMEKLFDSPVRTISKETGMSRPTVAKFFSQQVLKPSSTEIIYELCLDLIEEKEKKRKNTIERRNAIFNES